MSAQGMPASRIPDPMDAPALRWGVIGPGNIAGSFAESLRRHTRQWLTAVASRSRGRAEGFAERFGVERYFADYADLAASPDVDVVYISTPHTAHAECAELCLEAGKHVLIEKPVGATAAEADAVRNLAERKGLFAMEAMWSRFLPAFDVVRQILECGDLGEVRYLRADLGEHFTPEGSARLFDPALGGGALLDIGVYLTSFAAQVFGEAPRVLGARGRRAETGVTSDAAFDLGFSSGFAQLYTTMGTRTPTTAFVQGSRGRLAFDAPFYAPGRIELASADGTLTEEATFAARTQEDGLCYEAAEAARRIAAGETSSPLHPMGAAVDVLRALDEVEELIPR
ncbi:Gfo/Idh/MocA family protein [Rothia halotolerans]|uniref:Gfo/Idh/MocA family protein n=1 Tax=Rothia halotolerans TaxID=405770 RepID=UPI00101CE086|nr:Gfo/Idh/MocA family oxidoreductase [Rothia halotolerans]